MKKLLLVAALTACSGQIVTPDSPKQPQLTVTDAAASTFRVDIETRDEDTLEWAPVSYGTAWVALNGDGYSLLVTAGHVCANDDDVELRYELTDPSGKKTGVRVEKVSPDYDLCLMRSDRVVGSTLPIAPHNPVYDEPVFGVGAPLGVFGCDSGATIAECGMAPISRGFYAGGTLVSMPMYGGNSGSAVLTANGVIGVLVEGYRQFPSLSFIEPRDHLIDFLD